MPLGAPSFREGLRWAAEIVPRAAARCSTSAASPPTVGDEGGFAPSCDSNEAAIELVLEAIERAGYRAGRADRASP